MATMNILAPLKALFSLGVSAHQRGRKGPESNVEANHFHFQHAGSSEVSGVRVHNARD